MVFFFTASTDEFKSAARLDLEDISAPVDSLGGKKRRQHLERQ